MLKLETGFMQPIMAERLGNSFFQQWDEPDYTKSQAATLDHWHWQEQGSLDDALHSLHFRKTMTGFAEARNRWWDSLIIIEERHRKERGWEPALEKPLRP